MENDKLECSFCETQHRRSERIIHTRTDFSQSLCPYCKSERFINLKHRRIYSLDDVCAAVEFYSGTDFDAEQIEKFLQQLNR